jgi:hypothetical protein
LLFEFFMLEPIYIYMCGNGQRIFKKIFMSEIYFVTGMKSVDVSIDLFKEKTS